jgi:hypothetical protein
VAVVIGCEKAIPRRPAVEAGCILRDEADVTWAAPVLYVEIRGRVGEHIVHVASRQRLAPTHGFVERGAHRRQTSKPLAAWAVRLLCHPNLTCDVTSAA